MNQFNSVFGQILQIFSRNDFQREVNALQAEKGSKGFSCWDQFVAMMFCQLGHAHSLREICGGIACSLGKIKHLGLSQAPKHSTLAYANEHRPWQLFERVFHQLLGRCHELTKGKKKFRFKNKLYSLDATLIEMCLSLYDWAKFRKTKGAIKLHMLLDHDGYLPTFMHLSDGKMHEVKAARLFPLTPGSVVTMDRGYIDFALFSEWIDKGIYFVTRMKHNADYEIVEKQTVRPDTSIRKDEIIQMRGNQTFKKCPHCLRRIEVWDEKNQQLLVFLTNHFQWAASTIARIYKDRWQIETFFKTIKQNLKIKTFVGTSFNAIMIQIWTALIAVLLLKYLQLKSKINWALSNLVALLRMQLFVYRDLWTWIDQPFQPPPVPTDYEQLKLALN